MVMNLMIPEINSTILDEFGDNADNLRHQYTVTAVRKLLTNQSPSSKTLHQDVRKLRTQLKAFTKTSCIHYKVSNDSSPTDNDAKSSLKSTPSSPDVLLKDIPVEGNICSALNSADVHYLEEPRGIVETSG
ncbi:hypothetical protein TNCT_733021 [Trichonephila clavata]|uniref:Uncharacterized protein n=1 Tax=Trichonephila clavata TaxID=2740835 RepID=A0A8X6K9D3_TRICU|nr:hypothetical protein TNCT_733021 [Trichonephila clavata]